ncbi:O-mannosyltransferase Ogm4 [Schizosaccharomyces octosporus yFS286]|uniref:Dolichyl-phosphate-mannose--protein mannosyltransferase n=1 Tax=Schizosaccharomyces octosporus (strain yFS286) TaxID=483514 RepID=S9R3E3_SCHOY|nr:O-mannosyltransferase Ogm4 [Schizosaccharomyces octosporus yFS286]EPX72905.1 O-mannosyltransferase Ogm4 [Schizosaccharomyces octosporus yFS286]
MRPTISEKSGKKNQKSSKKNGSTSRPSSPPETSPTHSSALSEKEVSSSKPQTVPSAGPDASSNNTFQFKLAQYLIVIVSFLTRFWKLHVPNEVVFDEVHFGKFASYYIQGKYFFDLHPPFAKLLLAFVAWLAGYDGHYLFDNIGDNYKDYGVPYVAIRAWPALLSSLVPPLVFLTMKESGYELWACLVSACLVLFDNAHVAEGRLILLDATLVFSMVAAVYCYVRFFKLRHSPFSRGWWSWLFLTGVCLSCTISTKYVGLFTFCSIGLSVCLELWYLWDIKTGLPIQRFASHFLARFFCLIVFPFALYLFWFFLHFRLLTTSGPGDSFMSLQFQETLDENPISANATGVNYYDVVTIKHMGTNAFLHSHLDKYPIPYDDGRISSGGQQVTGYPFEDDNNYWMILPHDHYDDPKYKPNMPVKNTDYIKLHHVGTNTDLITHDVASPYNPTNEEFTTVSVDESAAEKHELTLFQLVISDEDSHDRQVFTKAMSFKLIHKLTNVAMWSDPKPLPDWGFNQQEINGAKNILSGPIFWMFDDILGLPEERVNKEVRVPKKLSFFKKYIELQLVMFRQNNLLTESHPYSSTPSDWFTLHHGIAFWAKNEENKQIYLLGNPIGWWLIGGIVITTTVVASVEMLLHQRGIVTLLPSVRNHFYRSIMFFYATYMFHYIPFYLMGRQLFLHHYLPAQVAGAMLCGAFIQLACIKSFKLPVSPGVKQPTDVDSNGYAKSIRRKGYICHALLSLALTAVLGYCFVFFAPMTYGDVSLSVPEWLRRKWLESWVFQYQK